MKPFQNTPAFIIDTLKLSLLQSGKEPEDFDENKPVLEVLGEWDKGEPELRHGLLLWSLQQAIKVDPSEHVHQSLQEIAEVLSDRDRLSEDEYKLYIKEVYEKLRVLEEEFEDKQPSREERDKKEYRKFKN